MLKIVLLHLHIFVFLLSCPAVLPLPAANLKTSQW